MNEYDRPLTPAEIAATKDERIGFSDIPELDEAFWRQAKLVEPAVLGRKRKQVRFQGPRRCSKQNFIVVNAVHPVGNDYGPAGGVCANPTQVIEMMMCVDEVSNWLIGSQPIDFRNHRQRTSLVYRRFDYRDKIAELDSYAVVRPSAQKLHSVCYLARLYPNWRNLRLSHNFGNR